MQFDRLVRCQSGEYDMSPADVTVTCNMDVDQFGKFVENQGFQIHSLNSLLDSACAVSDNLNDLIGELLVRGDLGVPSLYKILDDYRYESVELKVDLIRRSQRRQ